MFHPRRCTAALLLFVALASCTAAQPKVVSVAPQHPGDFRHEIESKDGLPHGKATGWHANGAIAYHGVFVRGERHGFFTYFHENGNWLRVEEYQRGTLLWSSANRAEAGDHMRASDLSNEELDERPDDLEPWWKEPDQLWLAGFPHMNALSNRSGAELRLSRQHVPHREVLTSSYRMQLALAQDFQRAGMARFGVYGGAQLSRLNGTTVTEAAGGRSTMELGARWLARNQRLALRLGASFALANDTASGHLVAKDTLHQDVPNTINSYGKSRALRSQATYVGQLLVFNYRIDAGFDLAVRTGGSPAFMLSEPLIAVARVDLGLGFATDVVGIAAQLTTASPLGGEEIDGSIYSAALSAQFRGSWLWPAVSLIAPLRRDDFQVGMALSLGRQFSLL